MMMATPRGWLPALTESCRHHHKPVPCHRAWRPLRGRKVRNMRFVGRRRHHGSHEQTHLPPLFRAGLTCPHSLLKLPVLAMGSRILGRGH
jgi:hypothetical protein